MLFIRLAVFVFTVILLSFRTDSNFPKFSDKQVWANSADQDQTAPRV